MELGSGEEISGEMIWKASDVLVNEFHKKGCPSGTVVTTTNCGDLLIRDTLAAAQCGAILHPVSPIALLKGERIVAPPGLLVQQNSITQAHSQVASQFPADTVVVLNTSGTSNGAPSQIPLTGTGLIAQLVNHGSVFSADWERTRLSILPHHHAFGLVLDLFLGIYMRQRVLCEPDLARSPHTLLKTLHQKKIGMLALVPRVLELLNRGSDIDQSARAAIADLHIHTGGAPIRPQLREDLNLKLRKLTIGYGLTEAGPGVLIDGIPIGCEIKLAEQISATHSPIHVPSSDRPRIINVRGPSLSPGITTDSDGFFCTNDLAIYDNHRIEVIGRAGPAIKDLNGTWIPLSLIEHELVQFPDVISARIYADESPIRVFIITGPAPLHYSKLSEIIEKTIKRRTLRDSHVIFQTLTPERQAELARANSKGFESLFP